MNKSVTEIIQELHEQANVEVDQFNELVDKNESINSENSFLHLQVKTLQEKLEKLKGEHLEAVGKYEKLRSYSDQIFSNGEKNLTMAKQAYRERDQMADKLATANETLSQYKALGTPKKIREKIKNYQNKVAGNLATINKSKSVIKEYRKEIDKHIQTSATLKASEAQSNMTTVWSENGDNLMLFPAKLSMQVGDFVEKQMTLLYMTSSGCGKLIGLDEDGTPNVCTMPKTGLRPKARTLEVAGEMLRKWKRQGWKVTPEDLDLGSK